jgi:hypothetical protein
MLRPFRFKVHGVSCSRGIDENGGLVMSGPKEVKPTLDALHKYIIKKLDEDDEKEKRKQQRRRKPLVS